MQLDWPENARIRQLLGERSSYYREDQTSIHPICIWSHEIKHSQAALSKCTDHKAGIVFTSIEPVLNDLVKEGKQMVNITSDSRSSHYCDKKIF